MPIKRIAMSPLVSRSLLFAKVEPSSFPFDTRNMSTWYSARVAIWQGVRSFGLKKGDRILAPAYACGSEIDPLLKSGLDLDYYRISEDLSPDIEHLEELCRKPTKALFITHYFGFAQPMKLLLGFARTHGLLVIEDNAHGLYSADADGVPLGSFGDMSIFSFKKSLPVPDGGGLVLGAGGRSGPASGSVQAPSLLAVAGKVRALVENDMSFHFPRSTALIKRNLTDPVVAYIKAGGSGRKAAGEASLSAEHEATELKLERSGWAMSSLAAFILGRTDHASVREARRRNIAVVNDQFKGGRRVRPLVQTPPEGCCPTFYPVWAEDRDSLGSFLSQNGIESMHFWSFNHKDLPIERFPFERSLKRHVLALPVHQSLDQDDMSIIAERLNHWNDK